jgi:uncharacterized protein YndB with AHSA1/START domain
VTERTSTPKTPNAWRQLLRIERSYNAAIEDVWDLWTTKEGIESWWGPDGFAVKVRKLELGPGGGLQYEMTAIAPAQAAFLKDAGMPLTTKASIVYTEVVARQRLGFIQLADFIPGVEPYNVATTVELYQDGSNVRLLLTFEAMHDEQWTQLAVMGRESELGKLAKLLDRSCPTDS